MASTETRTPGPPGSDAVDGRPVTASAVRVVVGGRGRGGLELDGETAVVVAAVRADVMRQLHLVAVRTLLERRQLDGLMRAPLALAGMRDASLGYTHEVAGSFGSSRIAMRWLGNGLRTLDLRPDRRRSLPRFGRSRQSSAVWKPFSASSRGSMSSSGWSCEPSSS